MENLKEKLNELREQLGKADAISEDYRTGFLSALSRFEKLLEKCAAPQFHVGGADQCEFSPGGNMPVPDDDCPSCS